ncbi:MAG TPA: erythromycin esterase family protein [Gemmatimonadaceae bacterium]|nr:erythromycin esterase family protein [Gemmatimonadaceae bacterium]
MFRRSDRREKTAAVLRDAACPLTGSEADATALLERAARAELVLIGEASHGTQEFYAVRAELTRRLIVDHGFRAVAIEADWPDTQRLHCFVTGRSGYVDSEEALGAFRRFPQWMWRNRDVVEFVDWLRMHNSRRAVHDRVGIYGLDLYSLYGSIAAVLAYLDRVDPAAGRRARARYACLERFREIPEEYGYAASFDLSAQCEADVVRQLVDLQRRARALGADAPDDVLDDVFSAEQNARLIRNAEEYYRAMFRSRTASWNLRDRHMTETLEAVRSHLARVHGTARAVVWAHNSHLGDARHTQMAEHGEVNVGQLVRDRYGLDKCFLIGLTTYAGSVTAAADWDAPVETMRLRPALPESHEALLHAVGMPRFALDLRDPIVAAALDAPRLERAVGVIYLSDSERESHYFRARLARQFDAVIHVDQTNAVQPLEQSPEWLAAEAPETYPTAL